MIYLDNNATTMMPNSVKMAMLDWCNRGNPSAGYASARQARAMMNELRQTIGAICGVDTCCVEPRDSDGALAPRIASDGAPAPRIGPDGTPAPRIGPDGTPVPAAADNVYKVIFTSGATESNCTVISGIIAAAYDARRRNHIDATVVATAPPHIVASAVEHKSILEMLDSYTQRGLIVTTLVPPDVNGFITADAVDAAIRPNTCLVCIMHANNETGAINNVRAIGAAAHRRGVPFHCDTAQTFGKLGVNPTRDNIDSFCISFHKVHGPPGCGALVIKQRLLTGYRFPPMLFGTQNEGLRGGTENLPGLGASLVALRYTIKARPERNARIGHLKRQLMEMIAATVPVLTYAQYQQQRGDPTVRRVVFLSGLDHYLPGTLLLAVVGGDRVCNADLKATLERRRIVVSVGSACNTASAKASHVLYALGADEHIRSGALRISLGDETTIEEVVQFARAFLELITKK